MTEVEQLPVPALPQPVSLHPTFDRHASPILDSYSPFPVFGNSNRSRDPFGLNAFLLHPHDEEWHITSRDQMNDSVDTDDCDENKPVQPSLTADSLDQANGQNNFIRSSSTVFRRRSPLGVTPPVSAERREAVSVIPSPDSLEALIVPATLCAPEEQSPRATINTKALGPRGFRRALAIGRRAASESVTPIQSQTPLQLPSTDQPEQGEASGPSTPVSTRSQSTCSATSSEGSCSEGLRTPSDSITLDVTLASVRLANALQDAEVRKSKGGWREWLGGRRGSILSLRESSSFSPSTTPCSETSGSPRASTTDLATIPTKLALKPSPQIDSPQPTYPEAALLQSAAHIRRLSLAKLSALRGPSPHPLALLLTRQHVNLPEEVAFSIPATKRVFPLSVNAVHGISPELAPAQGGLALSLAIRSIICKLERGEKPDDICRPRKVTRQNTIPRPRGVRDFVSRPPFEERMFVFYPDGAYSPISMARPGYGVWDLDFSAHVVSLADAEEPPSRASIPSRSSHLSIPRASVIGPLDDLHSMLCAVSIERESQEGPLQSLNSLTSVVSKNQSSAEPLPRARSASPHSANVSVDTLSARATSLMVPLAASAPSTLSQSVPSRPSPSNSVPTVPMTSFRSVRPAKAIATWDDSSDEELTSDEDEGMFATNGKRPPASTLPCPAPRPPPRQRTQSQPILACASRPSRDLDKALDPAKALETVSRARERRDGFLSGETERIAVGEQRRATHRTSLVVPPRPNLSHQRSSPNLSPKETRSPPFTRKPSDLTRSVPSSPPDKSGARAIGLPQRSTSPAANPRSGDRQPPRGYETIMMPIQPTFSHPAMVGSVSIYSQMIPQVSGRNSMVYSVPVGYPHPQMTYPIAIPPSMNMNMTNRMSINMSPTLGITNSFPGPQRQRRERPVT